MLRYRLQNLYHFIVFGSYLIKQGRSNPLPCTQLNCLEAVKQKNLFRMHVDDSHPLKLAAQRLSLQLCTIHCKDPRLRTHDTGAQLQAFSVTVDALFGHRKVRLKFCSKILREHCMLTLTMLNRATSVSTSIHICGCWTRLSSVSAWAGECIARTKPCPLHICSRAVDDLRGGRSKMR